MEVVDVCSIDDLCDWVEVVALDTKGQCGSSFAIDRVGLCGNCCRKHVVGNVLLKTFSIVGIYFPWHSWLC